MLPPYADQGEIAGRIVPTASIIFVNRLHFAKC
jgi:hypothetical protein